MIQEIGDRIFDNHYRPDIRMRAEDELFLFDEKSGEIGMKESEDGMLEIPKAGDAGLTEEECVYLFSIDDTRFFMPKSECSVSLPEGYEYRSPRVLRKGKPKDLCFAAMTAGHLNAWYKNNRMCGRCGTRTEYGEKERMMRCPKCGNLIFPRINPAVTVAVTHEDKLLVSRYNGRKQTNLYALIAGFVEIGESAEECVAREVMEEVGLKVKNIRYYGSQPWGFAGNLQIGYTADVDGDDHIVLDREELETAFFISREELEMNPVRPALTQEMIEAFRLGKIR